MDPRLSGFQTSGYPHQATAGSNIILVGAPAMSAMSSTGSLAGGMPDSQQASVGPDVAELQAQEYVISLHFGIVCAIVRPTFMALS